MMNNTKQRYYWIGINYLGEKMQGIIDTTSPAFAKTELHRQGITSPKIKKYRPLFKKKLPKPKALFFSAKWEHFLRRAYL